MTKKIRHKGLARFFESGDTRGINAQHAAWLH
jgi:proteic killer suppression protein